jgi:hypothetical protein
MLQIQILGIGCKKSRALKLNVMAALEQFPLPVEVEEIAAVNDIVQYQIHATPALLVNGLVISEENVPEVSEIKSLLANFLYLEQFRVAMH